ncbi:asparaginase domain-containing protein [Thiomicrorhabdus aquaedulcis]|uniref:asparaginase domain-containing protein n=1 Tax=Thiomicrorhabdus aquaedulcis TaxID=2211106 RepID=UPI000FD7A819|nr:asparaginase domain-containing protein [Thiomicrorhabdus aquaedulcis]
MTLLNTPCSLNATLQLFITGGTLDKEYDALSGELIFSSTVVPDLLKEANCTLASDVQVLMQKDSLHMTDEDRAIICQACLNASAQHIVITHGTDTMVQTALALLTAFAADDLQKTIVLTGAMRPFQLGRSDASFNLGSALMAAQTAPFGVYIVMNGRLFNAQSVQKNRALGVFEPL